MPPHIVAGCSKLSSIRPARLLAAWALGVSLSAAGASDVPPVAPTPPSPPAPLVSSPTEATPSLNALRAMQQRSIDAYRRAREAVVAIDCRLKDSDTMYYGSGVVISSDGTMLTGHSVVPEKARAIRVRWADGHVAQAEVRTRDASTETVVLRLRKPPETPLTFVTAAPDDAARIGARVYAAGNPHRTLERDGEVYWSPGVLSGRYAIHADNRHSRYHGPVLETDAAVNFGCDGGPLLDAHGRLLGLLSLAHHPARQLGIAVPLTRIREAFAVDQPLAAALRPSEVPASNMPAQHTLPELFLRQTRPAARAIVRIDLAAGVARHDAARSDAPPAASSAPVRFAGRSRIAPDKIPLPALTTLSGVLVEPRGTVLTCASLLPEHLARVDIALPGGEHIAARVRGRDLSLDLAVLELDRLPEHVEVLAFPDAAHPLRAGHWLAVLGAPLGDLSDTPEPTLTLGMLGATGRLSGRGLQIDALINTGNAGGAAIDLRGRLAGIVTQQDPRKVWGQNSGVGFVAPAVRIQKVLTRLRAGEIIPLPAQAFLGVRPAVGETAFAGVKLAEVLESTAAWQAGLRRGDVITALDDIEVRSWPGLVSGLKSLCAGQQVEVHYLRGVRGARTTVTLDALPDPAPEADE